VPVSIATRRAAEAAKVLRCADGQPVDDTLTDIFHYYRMMGYDVSAKIEAALNRYRFDLETEDLEEVD
jgi:hypothetical protein